MLERAYYLTRMLRAEWRSTQSLRAYQDDAVQKVVRHAALRVPLYRELYATHGLDADAFRGLDDLPSLPMVHKHLLRAAGDRVLTENRPRHLLPILTSGSTGEPYRFWIGKRHDQWRKAQYLRPYLSNGRRLHHKVLRLTAFASQRRPWFNALGLLREWQLDSATDPQHILARWQALRPSILQGYPSSLHALARYCVEHSAILDPAPRFVFTDSEMLRPQTRALMQVAFGTAPIDIFGTYETDNIAYQCAERGGYHVALDSVVLEIVRDGRVMPAGSEGELVVTSLTNRTHPFIRYRLGDIGRYSAARCPCGRSFPVLDMISGRADDMIVLADRTHRSPLDVLGRLDRFAPVVRHYQLHQTAVDRFELWIVPSPAYTAQDGQRILQAIEEPLSRAVVALTIVDAVPRDPSGKLRSFICSIQAPSRA